MKTILLIEDDAAILRLEQTVVRDAGYAADSVADGQEARARLKTVPYAGVVLNVTVPGCEGYDLAAQIGARAPLVVVGSDEPDARKRAFDAGAMAFIGKPFTVEAFRSIIHSVIGPADPEVPGLRRAVLERPPPAVAPALPETSPSAESIPVRFQSGPVYWCEPEPAGWRCGRCELGLIASAEAGTTCSVCQAEVVLLRSGPRSGLGWLVAFIALALALGWVALHWWS